MVAVVRYIVIIIITIMWVRFSPRNPPCLRSTNTQDKKYNSSLFSHVHLLHLVILPCCLFVAGAVIRMLCATTTGERIYFLCLLASPYNTIFFGWKWWIDGNFQSRLPFFWEHQRHTTSQHEQEIYIFLRCMFFLVVLIEWKLYHAGLFK